MENSLGLFLGPWLQSHIILWGSVAVWVTVFLFGENGALLVFNLRDGMSEEQIALLFGIAILFNASRNGISNGD